MQYILPGILGAAAAVLAVMLLRAYRQLEGTQAELESLRERTEGERQRAAGLDTLRDTLWDSANTIHLYAALTEEESSAPAIREKQEQILHLAGEILRTVEKL